MKRIPSVALGRHLLVIAGLALASTVGNLSAADTYYVSDHLATTTAVADAAGEIASLEADAFGSPVSGGEQAVRYTGKPYDADIGAYVFPFRNYRSDEARWMSADPSGFPDGINASVYTNDPNSYFDPYGLVLVNVSGSNSYTYDDFNNGGSDATITANFGGKVDYTWNSDQTALVGTPSFLFDPGWTGDGSVDGQSFKSGTLNVATPKINQPGNNNTTATVTWFLSTPSHSVSTINVTGGTRVVFNWSVNLKRTVTLGGTPSTTNESTITMLRQNGKFTPTE